MSSEWMELIAFGFLFAVGYLFFFGFERSGLGGKQRTFRSQVVEALGAGAGFVVFALAADWIGDHFGITNSTNLRNITQLVSFIVFAAGAIAWAAWRRSAKKRKRAERGFPQ